MYQNRIACQRFASRSWPCRTPNDERRGKVLHKRTQFKGTHENGIHSTNSGWFKGKCVLRTDFTLIQPRCKLMGHGANFVTGLPLVKAISFENGLE